MAAEEVYRSPDGRITVEVDGDLTMLRHDGRLQSSMGGAGGLDTIQAYLEFLHLPFAIAPHARRALCIGLGGGVLPKRVLHDYPDVVVDVVEIDPTVVAVARDYFGLPDDRRLQIHVDDGRTFLETTRQRYDIIVVDAYEAASMPFRLATREFIDIASARLDERGVLAYNAVGVVKGRGSGAFHRLLKGLRDAFACTYVFSVGGRCGGRRENIVVLASNVQVSHDELRQRIRDRVDGLVKVPHFETFADHLVGEVHLPGARPLRDAEMPEDGLLHG